MITKKYIKTTLIVIAILFMVSNPYIIMQSVKNGLIICYENIIPSLFVFMVISNYAASEEILNILSIPLRWYSRLMKVERNDYSGYLVLSLIGGFAVGARFISQMEKDGYPHNAINVLCIPMINNSLAFCVFAVGAGFIKNNFTGLLLYISLTISSLVTGFIISFFHQYNIVALLKNHHIKPPTFAESIYNATNSILSICGFVIVLNVICEVISLYTIKHKIISTILISITELTSGCINISEFYKANPYYFCVLLSVFPISTMCQVYHFTSNTQLINSLIVSRVIHTPLSMVIFSLLFNLFPVASHTAAIGNAVAKSFSYSAELSFTLFIISLVFLKITDKNRLFTNSV